MADREKQIFRRMKRDKKREGVREHRRALKAQLATNPDECSDRDEDFGFGHNSTKDMNGRFKDTKRNGQIDLEAVDDTGE